LVELWKIANSVNLCVVKPLDLFLFIITLMSLAKLIGKNNERMGHHFQADGPGGQFGAIYVVLV
jgi:hypothetical protein